MPQNDANATPSASRFAGRGRGSPGRPPSAAAGAFRKWMVEQALPFWSGRGWDQKHGGFHERMLLSGEPDWPASRRVRVQWRQIYVFAHASILGWHDGLKLAFKGLEHVIERAWSPDGRTGFVHVLGPDGTVQDGRRDSYDHAFALLALAWLARASDDSQVRALLDRVFHFVRDELTDDRGCLLEGLPPSLPRRQNPHMHMFEAMLALHENLAYPEAETFARRYRRMLEKLFIDRKSAVLLEFFDADWKPVVEDGASVVEPGHMVEWVWLLRSYERIFRQPASPLATHLLGSALRAGEPTHGFLIDEIDTEGRARLASRRLWPQTELIKAWTAQFESGTDRADAAAGRTIKAMLETYLAAPFAGGWIDQFDVKGQPKVEFVPASSLYHLFVAAAEADRVFG